MSATRSRRVLTAMALLLVLLAMAAGPTSAATRSAGATVSFVALPDGCHPLATATWTGYRVDHVRLIFVPAGRDPMTEWVWFGTVSTPDGRSAPSGTLTLLGRVPVPPGSAWQVYAIFRSNGGARLWEGISAPATVPMDCPTPPVG